MLLASAETKSRKLQSLTSDTAARIEFNNTEILQEVNTGSAHIIPILKVVISENYCSKEFLSLLLQIKLTFFKIHFWYILQDVYDVEERSRPNEKTSNSISKLAIYKNHLVRVEDIGLTWRFEFDITLYKMPAFDKTWINIFHLTQNGNADKDNILKFSIFRDGITGKFEFKYWTHKKEMLFAMNTKYHMVIEVF